jgi:hypothetical protein
LFEQNLEQVRFQLARRHGPLLRRISSAWISGIQGPWRTFTEVWTPLPITVYFVLLHFVSVLDGISETIHVEELVVTFAILSILIYHDPLLKATKSEILAEQYVESGVDGLSDFVSDEDNGVEAFKDHAYLWR